MLACCGASSRNAKISVHFALFAGCYNWQMSPSSVLFLVHSSFSFFSQRWRSHLDFALLLCCVLIVNNPVFRVGRYLFSNDVAGLLTSEGVVTMDGVLHLGSALGISSACLRSFCLFVLSAGAVVTCLKNSCLILFLV